MRPSQSTIWYDLHNVKSRGGWFSCPLVCWLAHRILPLWHSLWELMSPFGMKCDLSFCTGSICETKCIAFRFLVENSTWLGYMSEVHSNGKNANSPWEAEIELQRHKTFWTYFQTFGIICSLVQVSAQMISSNTGACLRRTHHEASRFQYHVQMSQPVYT